MKKPVYDDVISLYEPTANTYASMMDEEIQLPVYVDTLSRLHAKLGGITGPIVDVACGSGHMLAFFAEQYPGERDLIGVDLTPRMVELANQRLRDTGSALEGDMRRLPEMPDDSVAGLINFFAVHHLSTQDLSDTFGEWGRLVKPGGQLIMAAWEGAGEIDYGEESDQLAFKYPADDLEHLLTDHGFDVDRCRVETIEEMSMNAVYIDATRMKSSP